MMTGIVLPMPDKLHHRRGKRGVVGLLRTLGRVVWRTFDACMRFRVMGLAAEVAFFAVLSLPPLLFGLAGAVGFIARSFSATTVDGFRDQILHYAGRFLTPDAVNELLAPTLNEVLDSSRADIMSIGFVIALWSGSRAMAVLVDTSTIMYGMAGERGVVRTRTLSFLLYLTFLAGGAVLLPLVLAGPRVVANLLPPAVAFLGAAYWPIVLVGSVGVMASLFHVATPLSSRWIAHLPGAALTVFIWVFGSGVLRWFLVSMAGSTSIFGPLATPIALLMWLYLVAIAVLIGAALNAAVAKVAPRLAGISNQQADHLLEPGANTTGSTV